ncbi:MAG: oligosaccharide flippase family protein, partial [Planctomycetes bacterium]|nr:oligosaccharide flippase family protein [Planctomycetota bacterium]
LAGPWLPKLAQASQRELLLFSAGLLPLALVGWYSCVFRYLHRAGAYAAMNLALKVGSVLIALPLMLATPQERRLEVLFSATLIVGLGCTAWGIWKFKRLDRAAYSGAGFSSGTARTMFWCGIVMVPGAAVYAFSSVADRLIVQWFHGPAEVGILALSFGLAAPVFALKTWFAMVWDPHLVELVATGDRHACRERLQRTIPALLLAFMPLSVLAAVWSDPVVRLLYTENYHRAADLVPYLVLSTGVSVLSLVAVGTIFIASTPRYHPWVFGLGLLVNCGVGLAFVPRWGALGAIVGTLWSEIVILGGWVFLGRVWLGNLKLDWRPAVLVICVTGVFVALYEPGAFLGNESIAGERMLVTLAGVAVAAAAMRRAGVWPWLMPARGDCQERLSGNTVPAPDRGCTRVASVTRPRRPAA